MSEAFEEPHYIEYLPESFPFISTISCSKPQPTWWSKPIPSIQSVHPIMVFQPRLQCTTHKDNAQHLWWHRLGHFPSVRLDIWTFLMVPVTIWIAHDMQGMDLEEGITGCRRDKAKIFSTVSPPSLLQRQWEKWKGSGRRHIKCALYVTYVFALDIIRRRGEDMLRVVPACRLTLDFSHLVLQCIAWGVEAMMNESHSHHWILCLSHRRRHM